ncbi:MAG: hypothetical protein DMG71_14995 [Acidobacteria bacterium]|nr:MAG: hypothetical protein DMG71_14995 [Acidobacteriota bacterium]
MARCPGCFEYNPSLEFTIEKLIYGGDGLARMPADEHGRGKAVFVPFVLPGERVEVSLVEEKPGFARARLEKILAASEDRVEARCPYFQRCGGCHYQHARYEHQLAIKADILKENLRRIAKVELVSEVQVHPSLPWNYRNRTRLRVQSAPSFAVGYYKFGSHELLVVEECPISSPLINRAIAAVWKLGRAGLEPAGAEEIEFFVDGEDTHLLVEIFGSRDDRTQGVTTKDTKVHEGSPIERWAEALKSELPEVTGVIAGPGGLASLGIDSSNARLHGARQQVDRLDGRGGRRHVSLGEAGFMPIVGVDQLIYRTSAASYRVSAGSFFQVNRYLTDELVSIVTRGRSGENALDLYAGVGLFSTVLARAFHHIEAVESSQSSFADLQYNTPANVKAVRATVEQYVEKKSGELQPELIVVDPPRGGLGERVSGKLAAMRSPRITCVSCDPATLARDLKQLLAGGYRVEQVHLVDLFPQTYHLESVLQLVR